MKEACLLHLTWEMELILDFHQEAKRRVAFAVPTQLPKFNVMHTLIVYYQHHVKYHSLFKFIHIHALTFT